MKWIEFRRPSNKIVYVRYSWSRHNLSQTSIITNSNVRHKKISLYILRAGRSTTQLCMSAANFQSTKAKGSRFSWRSTAQMERHYAGYNCMNHRLDSEREIGSIKRLRSQRSPYIPWSHILMVTGITQRARRCREVESNPTQEIFKIHRANSHWLRNFRMQKPTKNTTQLGMACNCC